MSKKHRIDHAEIVKRFAVRLRETRIAAGLTQLELAERAGLAINYISRLETARVSPGIDTLSQLADALGVTTHALLPLREPIDTYPALMGHTRVLVDRLIAKEEKELIAALVPILARLAEGPTRAR